MSTTLTPDQLVALEADPAAFVETRPRTVEEVRRAWIEALRLHGARKCVGPYKTTDTEPPERQVCALILLGEVYYGAAEMMSAWRLRGCRNGGFTLYLDLGALAGLDVCQTEAVLRMNDGWEETRAHSFDEIASAVETWFCPAKQSRLIQQLVERFR